MSVWLMNVLLMFRGNYVSRGWREAASNLGGVASGHSLICGVFSSSLHLLIVFLDIHKFILKSV